MRKSQTAIRRPFNMSQSLPARAVMAIEITAADLTTLGRASEDGHPHQCLCGDLDTKIDIVQCDQCQIWFHYACVEFREEDHPSKSLTTKQRLGNQYSNGGQIQTNPGIANAAMTMTQSSSARENLQCSMLRVIRSLVAEIPRPRCSQHPQ